eukprot:gene51370-68757_t
MSQIEQFRNRVRDGELMMGTYLKTPSAIVAEVLGLNTAMARVGADTFGVLGEHGKVCPETVQAVFT